MLGTEKALNQGGSGAAWILLGILLSAAACQSQGADDPLLRKSIYQPVVDRPEVVLVPGDTLEVKFFNTPELNELQAVRPDGIITLQLVGDLKAQGKTPSTLRAELTELYRPHLKNPEVAVIVRSMVDRKVYVGGEVLAPGMIEMPGSLTALEAIMEAGGFDARTGEMGNVLIIRHKDGQRYGAAVDLASAIEGKVYSPFFLEPHDIVYVPPTTITQVTRWIDQHINQIIPLGFTLTQARGNTTIGFTKNVEIR